jgi:transcriptional regulator with XRE-family HTH domain
LVTLRAYAPYVYTLSRRQSTSHGVGNTDSVEGSAMTGGLGSQEKQVGQQLRRLRDERHLSQQQLADQMKALGGPYQNWRQSTIYKIEHGERPLRVNEMFDLAGVLGVPPEVLLTFDVNAAVLDSQIAQTRTLLTEAETEHDNAAKHLREFYDRTAGQREMVELAERDTAMRATRYKATLEVLYRLRANLSTKDGES